MKKILTKCQRCSAVIEKQFMRLFENSFVCWRCWHKLNIQELNTQQQEVKQKNGISRN